MGLLRRGAPVIVSPAERQVRKLPYTLELIKVDGVWVGVNTSVPNRVLHLAWRCGVLPEALGYECFRGEAKAGRSRLDAALSGTRGTLWVEAKNVTLVEDGVAYFPDAVTQRGCKHLADLISLARQGQRVACFYLVQRGDAQCFAPADFIDPDFASLFHEAMSQGVEMWTYQATVSPEGIGLGPKVRVLS